MDDDAPRRVVIHDYPVEKYCRVNRRYFLLGQSGSGKTILMYYLLTAIHGREGRIRRALGFSLSEQSNGQLGGFPGERGILPKILVYGDEFNTDAIDNFMRMQAECKARGVNEEAMVIADDVLCEHSAVNSPSMKRLLQMGRHNDIGFMGLGHGVTQVGPSLRTQFDVVIVADVDCSSEVFKYFFKGEFANYAEFMRCYESVVRPPPDTRLPGARRRRFMVLDRTGPPGGRIFKIEVPMRLGYAWGKVPEHLVPPALLPLPDVPLPRLCAPGFWTISDRVVTTSHPERMAPLVNTNSLAQRLRMLGGGGTQVIEDERRRGGAGSKPKKKSRPRRSGKEEVEFVV